MENGTLTELAGIVQEVIFTNEENGYTVLRLETDDGTKATVTGCLPFAAPGEELVLRGQWAAHASYGPQFQAALADRHMPKSAQAVYDYLASKVVKGVGPATASIIVSAFGEKSLEVMERSPAKLAALKGISLRRAKEISGSLRHQLGLRHLMELLYSYGLEPQYALRLYKAYGEQARTRMRENPYLLCAPHIGAPFRQADALALRLGTEPDSPQRVAASLLYELQYNSGNGHVFLPREKLVPATAQLLGLQPQKIAEGLDILRDSGEVVLVRVAGCEACYLPGLYAAEKETAERLLAMIGPAPLKGTNFERLLERVQREQGLAYAPLQRKTLELAAGNRLVLITGGPGTGKTTTVRAIIAMYRMQGLKVLLAAPTGRAAKRLTELTGEEAVTVHRLLEAEYREGSMEPAFKRCADVPLNCGALILDECSMIDILLMRAILDALPKDCRLVLVGDADQLPSVGPGNVFLDILRSGTVPSVCLVDIFRQTADSRIVRNAHCINRGECPPLSENKGDFFFLRRGSLQATVELAVSLCAQRLPQKMGIPSEEIQVLTPTRKGAAGVLALNAALQRALNPPGKGKAERRYGEVVFRVGDRVMQIRNNYGLPWTGKDPAVTGTGVFNGDIGYITAIDARLEQVTVDYDGRLATYSFELLSELEHAWAMTVHKSQGSEYRAVILCLSGGPAPLLYRGVLYTAVTRARELLILVGDESVVRQMIRNYRQVRRYSGLRARLAGEA